METYTQTGTPVESFNKPESLGLSKREYFAAMAMIGLSNKEVGWKYQLEKIAQDSVFLADCLIQELNNKS